MAVASVSTGIPIGVTSRNFARSSSREITRPTITTATDPKTSASATERLSTPRPVPADLERAVACSSILAIRSATSCARKLSRSVKCRWSTPLAKPASFVTARLVSALGPLRNKTRSAASKSWLRASWIATPVGTGHLLLLWHPSTYNGRMPTLSPDQSPEPGPERHLVGDTHQYREVAESFGSEAERYDRARPSYPSELVDRIVAT